MQLRSSNYNRWTESIFCYCTVAGVDNKSFVVPAYLINIIYILKIKVLGTDVAHNQNIENHE